MSRTAAPQPLRTPTLEVRLPALHAGQLEVASSEARFRVVCCGRQWGKSSLGAALAIREAARGGKVWWVAPTFDNSTHAWDIVAPMCAVIPGVKFLQRPIYKITFPQEAGGGWIQFRSADNPDSLRGQTLDAVIFDEAAHMPDGESAWAIVQPTLMIRKGWALFISTPKGDNWFKDLYDRADGLDNWASWRFPSASSPLADPVYIDEKKAETSSVWFAQEYLAEFISGASGVFRSAWFRYWWQAGDNYMLGEGNMVPKSECRRFATVDLAYSQDERADYTVISTFALTPQKHLLLLDVQRGRYEGHEIVPMLRSVYERFSLGQIIVERYQRQLNIIQEAVRAGLPIREVRPDKDKLARALPLVARMEHGTVWFPKGALWMSDLEREVLAFPGGRHDDFVDTLAYAAIEGARGGDGSGMMAV